MEESEAKAAPRTQAELEAAIAAIKGNTSLPRPPVPQLPALGVDLPMGRKIVAWQKYISSFEYNHTGRTYFNVRRDAGLQKLTIQAKEIIQKALPIQCVEAVFLATYLTHSDDLLRIPLSFKSEVEGMSFRHIVLAVGYNGTWGALGMSRKRTLMHKQLAYSSFSNLVLEYKHRYEQIWHKLVKVYVGFPFSHDTFCQAKLKWRVLRLRVDMNEWSEVAEVLDNYVKVAQPLFNTYMHTGVMPALGEFRLFSPGDDSDDYGERPEPAPKTRAATSKKKSRTFSRQSSRRSPRKTARPVTASAAIPSLSSAKMMVTSPTTRKSPRRSPRKSPESHKSSE